MDLITVKFIIKHDPCWDLPNGSYDVVAIRDVVGDGITPLALLRKAGSGRLTHADAIWVVTRPGVLSPEIIKKWLEVVATRAVANHAVGTCIDAWAQKWLSGEDRSSKSAETARLAAADDGSVRAAAWAAERAALAAASSSSKSTALAVSDAAAEAAEDAAAEAAEDAATVAAAGAAGAAAERAERAERAQQVADLIKILEGNEEWAK